MNWITRIFIGHWWLVNGLAGQEKGLDSFKHVQFSFRSGFPDRVTARLENILAEENDPALFRGLSSLFPRLSVACIGFLILFGLFLFYINGGFEPNALFGTEKIDETNFISYLILNK